jgi:hypothetical protein
MAELAKESREEDNPGAERVYLIEACNAFLEACALETNPRKKELLTREIESMVVRSRNVRQAAHCR